MRLIDADKLIARFKQLKGSDTLANMFVSDVIKVINEMTTEYDVDKVVEQLEEIRVKKTCNKEKCDEKELCRICVVDDAIEIVKGGGVDAIGI